MSMLRRGSSSPVESVLGPYRDFTHRTASTERRDLAPFFSELIKKMSPVYDISDDPANYVFAQIRALHADKVNGNGDHASTAELVQFRPQIQSIVFQSFIGRPHLNEHDDSDVRSSFGILVDSKLHLDLPEKPVRLLIAVDRVKFPDYADGLLGGQTYSYSMGCSASYCTCSECGNIATVEQEWCDHMRHHKGKYLHGRLMWEDMHGIEYLEESRVSMPADAGAVGERLVGVAGHPHTQSPSLDNARQVLRECAPLLNAWARRTV